MMTSTNRTSEEGDETELKPLKPQASTDNISNRDDITRDGGSGDVAGGEAGTDSVENVTVSGDGVRCWI